MVGYIYLNSQSSYALSSDVKAEHKSPNETMIGSKDQKKFLSGPEALNSKKDETASKLVTNFKFVIPLT